MAPLVLLATLAVQDPSPAINPDPQCVPSHTQGATEAPQDSARPRPGPEPAAGGVFLNRETILDRMFAGQGDPARNRAASDSLLRVHPEMKGLVLRELLMPKPLPGFFASSPPSVSEAWRLAGNSKFTAFEKSGLIKARQMELHDIWTEGRILAPQIDIKRTITWLMTGTR